MDISISFGLNHVHAADWIVVPIAEGYRDVAAALDARELSGQLQRMNDAKDLSSGLGETTLMQAVVAGSPRPVLILGLGAGAGEKAGSFFQAGVALSRRLGGTHRERIIVAMPPRWQGESRISELIEGVVVGSEGPGLRKNKTERHAFSKLEFVLPEELAEREADYRYAARRGQVVGQSINLARELANTPPSEKPPSLLARRAVNLAREVGMNAGTWGPDRLEEEGFGGLLGVAAGSDQPPAFVHLDLRGGGCEGTLVLVGKGVTFDSGGLSLKPSASMEDMKADMTGAAVVLATMVAAARLKLPVNLCAYLALTENMTGGKAMKLGDVLKMRDGTTVEVLNTDAEGRLILADALSYAVEQKPTGVIDLATLTGACIVALGLKTAGLFSNNDSLANEVREASKMTGERVWALPLEDDDKHLLRSKVADLKNVGGKWAGAITAAKFLEHFVKDTPWVHLDIAGPSWHDNDSNTHDAGGTGCFVRTLITLLENRGRTASRG